VVHVSSVAVLLIILLVLLIAGGLPRWPYSQAWGYYPAGMLGTVLVVVLILLLVGAL
jgi:hypothetical protein